MKMVKICQNILKNVALFLHLRGKSRAKIFVDSLILL